jgi:hypothetical protein
MAQMKHSGGIVDAVLELGFDTVKYFEITASGTAQTLTINPPARRLTLRNASTQTTGNPFYFNIAGDPASTAVGSTPGDNIKLGPECVFAMDFDTLTSVSFITGGSEVLVEGHLGWKGIVGC